MMLRTAIAVLFTLLCLPLPSACDTTDRQTDIEQILLGKKGYLFHRYQRESDPNTSKTSSTSLFRGVRKTKNLVRTLTAIDGRRRHLTQEQTRCQLWWVEVRYEDYEEGHFECEFTDPDLLEAMDTTTRDHRIVGTDLDVFLRSQGVQSGKTTLILSAGVELVPGGQELHLERDQIVGLEDSEEDTINRRGRRGLAGSIGELRTLVLRVNAIDAAPPSALALYDDIFGDQYCLKSQYRACSHGKLNIIEYVPKEETVAPSTGIAGGVVDLQINVNAIDNDSGTIQSVANNAARVLFQVDNLNNIFDLVLFCFPPGTGSWLAYAYMGRWDSYYNDKWCQSLSAQMHGKSSFRMQTTSPRGINHGPLVYIRLLWNAF